MRTKLLFPLFIMLIACISTYAQSGRMKLPIMIPVEGGSFMMGSDSRDNDEKPAHKVTLDDFYIGKYEVTFSEYTRFMRATGYTVEAGLSDSVRLARGYAKRNYVEPLLDVKASDSMKPVGNINWFDAQAYIKWLNTETGKNYRLPTEAEWEYAARGGNKSKGYYYVGGAELDKLAWYLDNAERRSHTVGGKMPNELGIYDMAGNIREWCSGWYGEYFYSASPENNPKGPDVGNKRLLRGGSYASDKNRMRLTFRNFDFPYDCHNDYGFRLVLSGEPKPKAAPIPTSTNNSLLKDLDSKGFVDIYGIYFDTGKSIVKPEGFPVIDQIAEYLKENPTTRIVVEGHTDITGSADKNQVLSENRAKSIKAELVKRGIDEMRLETKGYGSSKPIGDNNTKDGRTQNRRVTITKL
ncbi:MAG: SUMF1/EgtB/PvdO family nonheme iron enzyme [Bacteroidales bacterium]